MQVVKPPSSAALGQAKEVLSLLGNDKAFTAKLSELSTAVDDFNKEHKVILACRAELAASTEKVTARVKELGGLEAREREVVAGRRAVNSEVDRLHTQKEGFKEAKAAFAENQVRFGLRQSKLEKENDSVTAARQRVVADRLAMKDAVKQMEAIIAGVMPKDTVSA